MSKLKPGIDRELELVHLRNRLRDTNPGEWGDKKESPMPTQFLTNLAGLQFRPAEAKDAVRNLTKESPLLLEREPENAYDENAIKILAFMGDPEEDDLEGDAFIFIGYVEKLVNGPIALAMDEGKIANAHVEKTYSEAEGDGKRWMRPLIAIEVQSDADKLQ